MPAPTALLQEGRYRLDHPLAATNECSVFQGYDTVRDTKVVVKEIVVRMNKVTTAAQQENIKLNFVNTAKMLASVRHDSLIHVEDYFSEIGRQYLVLESVDGDDLETLLRQTKVPFSLGEVSAWADQILDALHYLHNFDPPILHGFVRPKNIHRQIDGRVKLYAYTSPAGEVNVSTGIDEASNDPAVLNYSPLEIIWEGLDSASQKVIVSSYDDRSEKILKSPADARSDIYSVGATLYHMLTARVPLDPLERSIEMLEGNPDPLAPPDKLNPSIPAEVSDVIMRAMEIKRENRFDSAVIMRQVLRTSVGKVQEREEDEARELEEAAEDLRFAEKVRQEQIQKLVEQKARELEEQKTRELEEEKRKAAELLEQKLREAEEMRLAAERRAAEAERLLQEQEAELAAAEAAAIHTSDPGVEPEAPYFEENLLELAVEPSSITAGEEEAEEVLFEDTLDPDVEPTAQTVSPAVEPAARVNHFADEAIPVEHEESPAALPSREADTEEAALGSTFSYQEARSGSKMPLVAGALVVVILMAIGGWVFLGSSSEPAAPAPAQSAAPSAVTQAAPQDEPAAPQAPVTSEPSQPETSAPADQTTSQQSVSPATEQQRTPAKPAPAKTAKPTAEPAKTPEKKKVTVDDLINDN